MRSMRWFTVLVVAICGLFTMSGCARYATPGGPAEISTFADPAVAEALAVEPTAQFPARIAIVRVQAPDYRSHQYRPHGSRAGRYTVAVNSDVEEEEHWERISSWPELAAIVRPSSLMLPERLDDDRALRIAAARLRADMVLIYTLDTRFEIEGVAEPLTVLTLGLLPNKRAYVSTRASAIMVDTQTEFVYGTADAEARTEQIANAWTSTEAVDQSRRRTEVDAFDKLVGEVETLWTRILAEHARPQVAQAGAGRGDAGTVRLGLDEGAAFFWNDERIDRAALDERLAAAAEADAPPAIIIGDADDPLDSGPMVIELMNLVRDAGLRNVYVIGQPEQE